MNNELPTNEPAQTESRPANLDETTNGVGFDQLAESGDPGIVREFVDFLRYNKKWWLTPILAITLLLIALVFLSASPAAPFIYTLF
jgi:hypothetical protein